LGSVAACELIRRTVNTFGCSRAPGACETAADVSEMIEARVSIDRKFMKKTARMLSLLACAGALCLGGCISPDLEPPFAGKSPTAANTTGAPGTVAERAAAAGTTAVTSTPSTDAATQPGNTPTTQTTAGASATAAPGVPGSASAGTAAPSTAATTPPTQTGAAGAAAGTGTAGDDADAGVGTP